MKQRQDINGGKEKEVIKTERLNSSTNNTAKQRQDVNGGKQKEVIETERVNSIMNKIVKHREDIDAGNGVKEQVKDSLMSVI
jgi:hypothetical protein